MVKIYESPDGGKTVYERESGSTAKTLISLDGNTIEESDLTVTVSGSTDIDSSWWIDDGTINVSSIVSSAITPRDTIIDENGKHYSFKELFNRIETIEKRLTILKPDDKLLDKYQILQDLYEQYKAAEALLYDNEDE